MSDEAARRIEKAFTTGGAYSGDDPVTVARAYLAQATEIERLRAALRDLINIPAVRQVLGERHTADCGCPLCRSRAALSPLPAQKENPTTVVQHNKPFVFESVALKQASDQALQDCQQLIRALSPLPSPSKGE